MKNFCANFLAKFAVDLDEIQYVAIMNWFVEDHAKFITYMIL